MTEASSDRFETFQQDELESDLRALVRAIETLHADPYVGYDSRTTLYAQVERLVRDLPEAMSKENFYRHAAKLVTGLDDAHSLLKPPQHGRTDSSNQHIPIALRVVGGQLFVESVTDESLNHLVGSRLLTIEDVSVPELADRCQMFRGAENRNGTLLFTASQIEDSLSLARLLERTTPLGKIQFKFESNGQKRSIDIAPTTCNSFPTAELEQSFPHPSGSGPRYRLYEGGDVALFVPGNLSDYRESLEAKLSNDADVATDLASRAFDRQVGGEQPDSVETTIEALPSMTQTLETMAQEMTAANTNTLIIDLRDNPGGDSQVAFHLAYLLGGWSGIKRAADAVRVVKRRTKLHQQRYGNTVNESRSYEPAKYDFSGYFASSTEEDEPPPIVRQLLSRSQTASKFIDKNDYDGLYTPKQLLIVVSAGTMSSAFACAAQLTTLGAEIIGVPPGQGPISFGEPVEQTLQHTDLKVRLASSLYNWLENSTDDILVPDRKLTPDRFKQYNKARDAGVRLAFEHAGYDQSPPTRDN